ncbi:MAG: GNAT family N-acetyltransferase [Gaiellaceae bacterium]
MTIPLPIRTARLCIRPFDSGDVDPMANVYGDPEVMRHVCIGVLDRPGTAALLEDYRRAQEQRGFSTWAVVEKASGAVIGDVGFGLYEPTGEPELGYTLAASAWGRGYALEAARACVDAAFSHLPQHRLVAKIEPENERSLRLAQRLGMRTVETVDVDGVPHLLLALERR